MSISFQFIEYIECSLQNFRGIWPHFCIVQTPISPDPLTPSLSSQEATAWLKRECRAAIRLQLLKWQSGRRQPLGRVSIGQPKRSIAVGGCPGFLAVLAQRSAFGGNDLNLQKVIDEICNRTGRQRVPLSWSVIENVLCHCVKIVDAMNGSQIHVPYWRPRRKQGPWFVNFFICWSIGFEFWGSSFSVVVNSGPTLVLL